MLKLKHQRINLRQKKVNERRVIKSEYFLTYYQHLFFKTKKAAPAQKKYIGQELVTIEIKAMFLLSSYPSEPLMEKA
jgi:hypothetical protein